MLLTPSNVLAATLMLVLGLLGYAVTRRAMAVLGVRVLFEWACLHRLHRMCTWMGCCCCCWHVGWHAGQPLGRALNQQPGTKARRAQVTPHVNRPRAGRHHVRVKQDQEGEEEEEGRAAEDEDEDEDDETPQEVRIVPAAGLVVEGPGDILDRIFEALSKGSELNPDGHEDGSEDDEYDDAGAALLLAASQGMEGFVDTDAMLRGATPAQRAALERYDAMLDTSAMETGVGALPMDIENDDGRFDDAEED